MKFGGLYETEGLGLRAIHTRRDDLRSHQFKGPLIDVTADHRYRYRAQCEWPFKGKVIEQIFWMSVAKI